MAWSQLAELLTPPIAITDFLYLRFIGDRTIHEEDFGKIQKDRVMEMKKWASKVKKVIKKGEKRKRKRKKKKHQSCNSVRYCQYIQEDGAIAGSYMGKRGEGTG